MQPVVVEAQRPVQVALKKQQKQPQAVAEADTLTASETL